MKQKFLFLLSFLMACRFAGLQAKDYSGQDVYVNTAHTTLLLLAKPGETPRLAYYGARISENEGSEVWGIGSSLNQTACPTFNGSTAEGTVLSVCHTDGQIALDLEVKRVERDAVDGGERITIHTADRVQPVNVDLCFRTYEASDVIEAWTEITHTEKGDITLLKYATAVLPLNGPDVWVSNLYGKWANEAMLNETRLTTAGLSFGGHNGVLNNQSDRAEVMVSLDGPGRENSGRTIGAALCWSGNYRMTFASSRSALDSHSLRAGIDDEMPYRLSPRTTFRTPALAISYSSEGRGGVSRNFHRWARQFKLHNGSALRDVLLNSWEGVYMNVNEEKMVSMMHDFAGIGGELFVMDDGWFASEKYTRDGAGNAALGDWNPDPRKLPNGLRPLIDEAKKDGLRFGIWLEPEMGNWKASALYDKHPDWFLQNRGREPRLGRGGTQDALDLTNPKVQDFVFSVFDRLLTENPEISYIKWDANCDLANYGSTYLPANRQAQIYVDYHFGLQRVLDRLRAKYPNLVMQACASGGGRVNYGVMPYFDEFWTSDNTDALQRIFIQWGTSYFYPACAMACHVSASPNHQTGRRIPLKYRFDVAMSGRLGIEMKPSDFTDAERAFARQAIADYKRLRPVVQQGDLYRLVSPYEQGGRMASLMYVAPDKSQAVVYAYKLHHMEGHDMPRVCLAGLDPDRTYRITEINHTGQGACHLNGKTATGRVLMEAGLNFPLGGEYASRVLELKAE